MEILVLLLGLGALVALADFITSPTDDNDSGEEGDSPEEGPDIILGTAGDDYLVGSGGSELHGLGGNDTLYSSGNDTMFGGAGDDVLIADMSDPLMFGGDGVDTFQIIMAYLDTPTETWPVIGDFDPGEDNLIIDLIDVGLQPAAGPVTVSGVAAPDGDGMAVLVNGHVVVQLQGIVSDDMQATLELFNFATVGGSFVFGAPP